MNARNMIPENWDRSGLPGWTYFSERLHELEKQEIFRKHWQLVCHENDVAAPGDYYTLDIADERGLVIRGQDGQVRGFHNLCRHRGSRVVGDEKGHCNQALICPFHGWAYNLDGTLRGASESASFPSLDRADWGLKPLELEIWQGFIFIRFVASDQPSVKSIMGRFDEELKPYDARSLIPATELNWAQEVPVNWKSVRDVDNEGYHVRQAHPGLHDLYGSDYLNEPYSDGASRTIGRFNKAPSQLWSVRNYRKILADVDRLPPSHRDCWLYVGMFPNLVFGFYPDSVIFYQEVPISATRTVQRGAIYKYPDESREMRLARYLSGRIDGQTGKEDQMLCVWSCEATLSSGYDGIILSDLEYGLKTFHDHLRAVIPVMSCNEEPETGSLRNLNASMRDEPVGAE